MFKKIFNKWNNIDFCPKCKCKETIDIPKDYINWQVCEEEIRCANCNDLLDYWAYGYSQAMRTRTEQLHYVWYHSKISWSNIKMTFYILFHKDIIMR
jgi:phage FluMu protein Com